MSATNLDLSQAGLLDGRSAGGSAGASGGSAGADETGGTSGMERSAAFLEGLREAAGWLRVTFDRGDEMHMAKMQSLFGVVFPDVRLPSSLIALEWKEMGFQRRNPVSDLRASGMLGVWLLEWMATHYTDSFLELVEAHRPREAHHYPVAAAGLNITALIVDVLQLRIDPGYAVGTPIYVELASWLTSMDDLGELFTSLFLYFEDRWHADQATYMGFNAQMSKVRERLLRVVPRRDLRAAALAAAPFSRTLLDERLYDETLGEPTDQIGGVLSMCTVS